MVFSEGVEVHHIVYDGRPINCDVIVDLQINSYYRLPSERISPFNPSVLLCNISSWYSETRTKFFSAAPIVPFNLCQLLAFNCVKANFKNHYWAQ